MVGAAVRSAASWLGGLTGPILSKEMRVSSRRRRNYVLRFVYLLLLTAFVALVWMAVVREFGRGSSSMQAARMPQAGIVIIVCVMGFQFFATQLVALVTLSTSVSDEIYGRTLGVLMTTPINSFQIIMGKLLSKVWQILILLGISLPLLAVVRVFGGVPWEFVVAGLCVTLTAVLFIGSVSMFFSIRNRRAYAVILKALAVEAALFLVLPWMLAISLRHSANTNSLLSFLFHTNPFMAGGFLAVTMVEPRAAAGGLAFYWPAHCAVMLGASALLLALCTAMVRRAALRQAMGEIAGAPRRRRREAAPGRGATAAPDAAEASAGRVRPVRGSPIVWKELRAPLLRRRLWNFLWIGAGVLLVLAMYGLCWSEDALKDNDAHAVFVCIFTLIGSLGTAVLSATTITAEKESRAWPVLLCTGLSDWEILWGKAVGIVRRCAPAWLFLAGHLAIFTAVGYVAPVVSFHLAMVVAWVAVFFTGSGLYFSARFRKTTTAVVMNIALGLTLWAVLPGLLALAGEAFRERDLERTAERLLNANPVVHAVTVTEGASGSYSPSPRLGAYRYQWPDRSRDFSQTTQVIFWSACAYSAAGLFLAWLAKRRFRRNVF